MRFSFPFIREIYFSYIRARRKFIDIAKFHTGRYRSKKLQHLKLQLLSDSEITILGALGPNTDIKRNNIHIGEYTYGFPIIHMETTRYHVYIGKFCSIASDVHIIVDSNHRYDTISTYPFDKFFDEIPTNPDTPVGKGDITIGNDVWIGQNVIILPGISIGDGAIVGAGSVVSKNIENYEIVAGNPGRHIKFRFSQEHRDLLDQIQWWNWPIEEVILNADTLTSSDFDELKKRRHS